MDIKRTQAANIISNLRLLLAKELETGRNDALAVRLKKMLQEEGVDLPTQCTGEAHTNPHIDNCGVCMKENAWGWKNTIVKVK